MTRIRLLAMLAVSIGVGGALGWFRPLPDPANSTDAVASSDWQIPSRESLERSSASLLAQARTLKWQGDHSASNDDALRKDWTLKAILPAENAVLLQVGKDALISRVEVGATLPDGSNLVAVRGDTVTTELDGCRLDRHLYPRASDSDSPECRTDTSPKDAQEP